MSLIIHLNTLTKEINSKCYSFPNVIQLSLQRLRGTQTGALIGVRFKVKYIQYVELKHNTRSISMLELLCRIIEEMYNL